MKPIPTKILFQQCYGDYAIPAVNVFTMEQVTGVFSAAAHTSSPVIVQTTPVARNYATAKMLLAMIQAASETYPDVVYAIHLDHGTEEHIHKILEGENYTSIMLDASHDDFETNIKRTRAVVDAAHQMGIQVEAELGVLSGVEDDLSVDADKAKYTDPGQAYEFVERTGCDSLAVAVGTSHGAYKFHGDQGLNFTILKEIQEKLPEYPLVLHGASCIKDGMIRHINELGGRLQEDAHGVKDDQIQKAIKLGVCKINMATDFRLLWTEVHRKFFVENPEQFDPIIPGGKYIKEFSKFLIERFEVLGCLGKSRQIRLK